MGGLQSTGQLAQQLRRNIRRFRSANQASGFTVVEVLIVLAVTGLLFTSAAILIAGKQNQTAFNQAIQQIQSQIQQTMNEAAIGYFPSNATFQCSAGGSGPVIGTLTTNAQGTNSGCIFIGKAMQFGIQASDPEELEVYSLAGLRLRTSDGQESQSLGDTKPTVVDPLNTNVFLQNGLRTDHMTYNNGGPNVTIGAFAFTTTFPTAGTGGNLTSGSLQLNVVPIDTSTLSMTQAAGEAAIIGHVADSSNVGPNASPINPSKGISICFASGGTKQSGLLTIGGNGHPLAMTLKIIDGNTTCS